MIESKSRIGKLNSSLNHSRYLNQYKHEENPTNDLNFAIEKLVIDSNQKLDKLNFQSENLTDVFDIQIHQNFLLHENKIIRSLMKRMSKAISFIIERKYKLSSPLIDRQDHVRQHYNNLINRESFLSHQFDNKLPDEIEQEVSNMLQQEKNFEREYLKVLKQHKSAQQIEKQVALEHQIKEFSNKIEQETKLKQKLQMQINRHSQIQMPKSQKQNEDEESHKIRYIKDLQRQNDLTVQKINQVEAQIERNSKTQQDYDYKQEKLFQREQKCLSFGMKFGLNFGDAEEPMRHIMNEYYEEKIQNTMNQLEIQYEAIESQKRKYQTITDKNKHRIQALMNQIQSESQDFFELNEEHSNRLKEYALMRKSFENKKNQLHKQMLQQNNMYQIKQLLNPRSDQSQYNDDMDTSNIEFDNLMNGDEENESYLNSSTNQIQFN
eukprot:403335017